MTDLSTLRQAQSARVRESCAHGFERLVEKLFNHPRLIPGTGLAEVPVVGGVYLADDVRPALSMYLPRICGALVARERFRQDAPAWAGELPVHVDRCMEMRHDECPRVALVAHYGFSLLATDPAYDYDAHPAFDTFARGLMADAHTPTLIRNDPARAEFPPEVLPGICDGMLYWRTDEKIAFDRDMLRRAAAQSIARAAEGW
jgi:hypothetical protein